MGELFRRVRPKVPLAWTGERLVSDVIGPIESEHLHRYFLARELCRGKRVLDVASGEGYGTALLAQTAEQAIGVELDPASVEHASNNYQFANLRYLEGEATRLPLEAESVDVVTSFETLEHFFDHELFVAEVLRVLRPEGLLIISTPDAAVYSGSSSAPNPFHVRELSKAQFSKLLHNRFRNVSLYRQRALLGSAVFPECGASAVGEPWLYDQRDADTFEVHRCLPRAPYLLAIASNATPPALSASIYAQADFDVKGELERLQQTLGAYRKQDPVIAQQLADAAQEREEATRLAALVPQLEAELTRLSAVEQAYRAQEPAIAQELAKAAAEKQEAEATQAALLANQAELRSTQVELRSTQAELLSAQAELRKALEEATEDSRAKQAQLDASSALVRQQTLFASRLQRQLTAQVQSLQAGQTAAEALAAERDALAAELAREREVCKQVAGLIIPVWIRKLVPTGLRPVARAMKRAIRS